MMRYGFGMFGFGWIIQVILIGVVIYAVTRLPRGGHEKAEGDSHRALEILKERLAKGEIGEEEFVRKKELLK